MLKSRVGKHLGRMFDLTLGDFKPEARYVERGKERPIVCHPIKV